MKLKTVDGAEVEVDADVVMAAFTDEQIKDEADVRSIDLCDCEECDECEDPVFADQIKRDLEDVRELLSANRHAAAEALLDRVVSRDLR